MDLCTISRALSRITGGRPGEMLCSRAHRCDWTILTSIIDVAFLALRGERDHCRRCWEWERQTHRRAHGLERVES